MIFPTNTKCFTRAGQEGFFSSFTFLLSTAFLFLLQCNFYWNTPKLGQFYSIEIYKHIFSI